METASDFPYRETPKEKENRLDYSSKNDAKQATPICVKETVIGIDLLLETMLEHLPPQDLKECRRVSKYWNYKSTKILLKMESFQVNLSFEDSPNKNDKQKLVSLKKTIKKSRKLNLLFPSCNLMLRNCDMSNPNLQHALPTFGHMIHTLSISFGTIHFGCSPGRFYPNPFKKLLLLQLPNLERLTINTKNFEIWDAETRDLQLRSRQRKTSKSALLPKLNFFRVSDVKSKLPGHVFEFLIHAAVNLKEIELYPSRNEHLLDVLRSTKKMHLLVCTIIIVSQDSIDLIHHFGNASARLNLKRLHLYSFSAIYPQSEWLRATKAVTGLLRACAHSLHLLQSHPFVVFPEFEVPRMPQLRDLLILVPKTCFQIFDPATFKISRVFPRLSSIVLKYAYSVHESNIIDADLYENNFLGAAYEDTVLSLDDLTLEAQPQLSCIQKLPQLFPNLKTIVMLDLATPLPASEVFYSLPLVEVLHFSISLQTLETLQNENWSANAFTVLDAALTGIPEETCGSLFSTSESIDAATLKELRLKRSMLDAKCLRHLIIGISDDFAEKRASPPKAILTNISRQYAFEPCPKVEIDIRLSVINEHNLKYLMNGVSPVLNTCWKIVERNVSNTHYEYSLTSTSPAAGEVSM